MKPVLAVFGNCQAQGLLGALAGLPTCTDRFDLKYIPSHPSMGDVTVDPEVLRRCAVVWEQVGMNQRLPGWESLPAGARHVRFAELSFPILWPFNCVDPRNRHDPPAFPWGAWPYGDRIALQVAKEGLRGLAAVAAYVERGSRVIPNPERMLDMEIARSRKRDANVDLSMTSYILEHFRQKRLFATYNHASNALIWVMFERLMQDTVLVDLAIGEEEFARCRAAFMDPELVFPNFDNFQMPIPPSVVLGYGLEWINEATTYRYFDEGRYNFADFMIKYIEYPFPKGDTAPPAVSIVGSGTIEAKAPNEVIGRELLTYAKLTGCPPSPAEPPITPPLGSRLCRQADLVTDSFRYWMMRMNRTPVMNRRYWEWYYIAQTLWQRGLLAKGVRGIGFDDADSPLADLFTSLGCNIVRGDLAELRGAETNAAGPDTVAVTERGPHAGESDGFDFCWSSACLSNLGSIQDGLNAVVYSLSLLRKGGGAVHATDHVIIQSDNALETKGLSLFHRSDMEQLRRGLETRGHTMSVVDWDLGLGGADSYIDRPPYRMEPHLKLQMLDYIITSLGLNITKGN